MAKVFCGSFCDQCRIAAEVLGTANSLPLHGPASSGRLRAIVASPGELTYEIWSDGACAHETTGAGGYAAVLIARRSDGGTARQWEVFGGDLETTNNRMELMAVITGLRDLPAPARVCIFIDSTYVKKNFGDSLERWQLNGWRTADGKPVKNRDLWEELFAEVACRKVKWVQVPGHTGVPLNERADQLACAQRDAYAERSRRRAQCPSQNHRLER